MTAGPHIKMAILPIINAVQNGVIELKTPPDMNKMMGLAGGLESLILRIYGQFLFARLTAIIMRSGSSRPDEINLR